MNKIKTSIFHKECQPKSELASYSIGSDYPLKGCSSAEPFAVLSDSINVTLPILCKEIDYKLYGSKYWTLRFQNDASSYELRGKNLNAAALQMTLL